MKNIYLTSYLFGGILAIVTASALITQIALLIPNTRQIILIITLVAGLLGILPAAYYKEVGIGVWSAIGFLIGLGVILSWF